MRCPKDTRLKASEFQKGDWEAPTQPLVPHQLLGSVASRKDSLS